MSERGSSAIAAAAPVPPLPEPERDVLAAGARPPGIWELAWPTIISNLLQSTVGLADMIIVGSLGASAVAAVTTGNRLFFVLQAVLMGITVGTTALVARAWGAGDIGEAERVTRASVWLCAVLGLLLGAVGIIFADPLARVFRLEAEAMELGAIFIRWLSVFNVSFAVMVAIGVALRAAGDVITPLWIGGVTNVINVALVYALVYGRLGFPQLGVKGAAIASGVAFSVGALISLALWFGGRLCLRVGRGPAATAHRLWQLVRIGYPAGIEQFVMQLGFIAFLYIVSFYGTAPYAAYGIGVQILAFSFVVGFGFSIAASTLVGQHLGAGDPAGAEYSGWHAMRMSMTAMVILGLVIVAAAEPIARVVIDDPAVVRFTVLFIYILGACQPLMAIEFTLGGALRGAGDTRFPLMSVFLGFFAVRVPLAALFAWLELDVVWVYGALIADYLVKGTLLTARFRRGRWASIAL